MNLIAFFISLVLSMVLCSFFYNQGYKDGSESKEREYSMANKEVLK